MAGAAAPGELVEVTAAATVSRHQSEMTMQQIEYRVRPVTRYVVTRYEETDDGVRGSAAIRTLGEYDNREVAQEVGYALCKAEHERLGWPPGDMRIIYPTMVPVPINDSPPVQAKG